MGYPIDDLRFYKCRRPFRFGSGKIEYAQWCGAIPASSEQKPGALCIYAARGRAPVLSPRPRLEVFGVQVACAEQAAAWIGGDFEAATLSPQGSYT
eukprot:4261849-Pyramimonas_sp.AAC.1